MSKQRGVPKSNWLLYQCFQFLLFYYLICWLSVDVSSFLEMKIDGAYQI
mgnify:CR=1